MNTWCKTISNSSNEELKQIFRNYEFLLEWAFTMEEAVAMIVSMLETQENER